jgi:hypothetical protein
MINFGNKSVIFVSLLIAGLLFYLSFYSGTSKEIQAYLFPRTVSTIMLIVTVFLFYQNLENKFLERERKTPSVFPLNLFKLYPTGIGILLFMIFAEDLGFYFSTTILFMFITLFYSEDKLKLSNFVKSICVCSLFMGLIYVLFTILLKVQVPGFILFQ